MPGQYYLLSIFPLKDVLEELGVTLKEAAPRVCVTEVHGLAWNMLRDSSCFVELWPDFSAFMSGADYLVAHNASFDRRVLRGCCRAADIETPDIPFLCTVFESCRGFRLRRNRLNDVCAQLGIAVDHHKAYSDVLACAKIYLHLRKMGLAPDQMRLK